MKTLAFGIMGLLSFLFGCDSKQPYHKEKGRWYFEDKPLSDVQGALTPLNKTFATAGANAYYRDARIPDGDGTSFEALSDHYAKDAKRVYYCDANRESQTYFTTRRIRIREVSSADPSTFRYLDSEYAKDKDNVFYEGNRFAVTDVTSFEPLDYPFARDRVTGYFMRQPITGSDGATFERVDSHFSKDKQSVFYSVHESGSDPSRPTTKSVQLPKAKPASFVAMEYGYATDSAQVYFESRILPDSPAAFRVLDFGYAKSDKRVYYLGDPIPKADAASFTILSPPTDSASAQDAAATYKDGRRTLRGR